MTTGRHRSIPPRVAVVGRHPAVDRAPSGRAGSTPAPRTLGIQTTGRGVRCLEPHDSPCLSVWIHRTEQARRPWPCPRPGRCRFTSGRGGIRKTHRPQTPADRKVHESSILSARTLAGARPRAGDTPSICWSRFPSPGSIPAVVAPPSRGDAVSMKSRAPAVPRLCGNWQPTGPLPRRSEFDAPGAHAAHSAVVQRQHTWL
jgi:hypothetical protein